MNEFLKEFSGIIIILIIFGIWKLIEIIFK
jgi:hypothetical protein